MVGPGDAILIPSGAWHTIWLQNRYAFSVAARRLMRTKIRI
jgi:hypothetical protein